MASKYEELECLYAAVGKVIYEGLTNYEKATSANPSQLFGEHLCGSPEVAWAVVPAHWTAVMGKPARPFRLMGCFLGVWYSVYHLSRKNSLSLLLSPSADLV